MAQKQQDESQLMVHHRALEYDVTEDQLALAAMHYLRAHYQEAADIYKNLFKKNRKYLALNVYIALCYYKLDYYDVSGKHYWKNVQNTISFQRKFYRRTCNNIQTVQLH